MLLMMKKRTATLITIFQKGLIDYHVSNYLVKSLLTTFGSVVSDLLNEASTDQNPKKETISEDSGHDSD